MKWTTEKPTEPGWYWTLLDFGEGVANWPEVVQIKGPDAKRRFWMVRGYGMRLEDVRAQRWAGPIPMPEEP